MVDPNQQSPVGLAISWATRIMLVAVLMFAPGLLGQWLDERNGTGFFTLPGFLLGLVLGVFVLLLMTGAIGKKPPPGE